MTDPAALYQKTWKTLVDMIPADGTDDERIFRLYRLFNHVLVELTARDRLQFHSLFARIAWLATMAHIPGELNRLLHQSRIDMEQVLNGSSPMPPHTAEDVYFNAIFALGELGEVLGFGRMPEEIAELRTRDYPRLRKAAGKTGFVRHMRVMATEIDTTAWLATCVDETSGNEISVELDTPGRSDLYRENLATALDVLGLPFHLSLADIEISDSGVHSPRVIIVEPDYLVDVTAIAECFAGTGPDSRMYVLSAFTQREFSVHILLGNMVNIFLDELMRDPELAFDKYLPTLFRQFPVQFAMMNDADLRTMLMSARRHFENLRQVVSKSFPAVGIKPGDTTLEPSFYAPMYGIQGRLDVFQRNADYTGIIVELKSGRPFNPNVHGLSSNHYVQTLLYDLLVKATFSHRLKLSNYILYSSQADNPLRFAPPVSAIQREALRLRNDILLEEHRMCIDGGKHILTRLGPEQFPELTGYMAHNALKLAATLNGLSELERRYFIAFNRLITNEYYLAKVGEHGLDSNNGLAGIWRDSRSVKEEQFNILADLFITDTDQSAAEISLRRSPSTNELANFRVGDITVLYAGKLPEPEHNALLPPPVTSQVYKCSIIELESDNIKVRLRNRQVEYSMLNREVPWYIEHDVLDSSFHTQRKALVGFAGHAADRRALFLGSKAPRKGQTAEELSARDVGIVQTIIAAPDYFLLWGPPGTGKTSIFLRDLVLHYLHQTDSRIMLLAYTNRAVDEICSMLDGLGEGIRKKYLRIGSRISTGEKYKSQLLSQRIEGIATRRELRQMLASQRVVVGTISSIAGKPELFDLLNFDCAIIDEASQILEPLLADILLKFPKWVLIGDHKQLPAVVAQDERLTRLDDDVLAGINLTDTRMSYFERIFTLCESNNWTWAVGKLYEQGRMHSEIMRFPSQEFYGGILRALAHVEGVRDLNGLLPQPNSSGSGLQSALAGKRMIFVRSEEPVSLPWNKTNDFEAEAVALITGRLLKLNSELGRNWSIGIVTPFRA